MTISPRESVCKVIAALSPSCSAQDVESALAPVLDSIQPQDESEFIDEEDGVSPLILACDKGNVACLEYLLRRRRESSWMSSLIGKPLQGTLTDGNTAMHHAAMEGCVPAISILQKMGASALQLGSTKNSHSDTPLMMAAVSGKVEFCKVWHATCLVDEKASEEDVLAIWGMSNDSGDSCLSLACVDGQCDVVEFLLSVGVLAFDSHSVREIELLYERRKYSLQRNPSPSNHDQDEVLRAQLMCLEMLKAESERLADKVAEELLQSESQTTEPTTKTGKSKAKNHKKKNKRKENAHPENLRSTESLTQPLADANAPGAAASGKDGLVEITTLPDGTKAVRVESTTFSSSAELSALASSVVSRPQRSATEMFRDRFAQQRQISTEVDSVMQALCLDVSMLLYTSHGMAMDLSPSQLDAVQDILERQLGAVREARVIQDRLHK